jgi:WD40 repeat protein
VEGVDQYGDYIYTGTITWSVNDEQYGTIDEDGNFTAGQYSGICYVYASVGSIESERISIEIIEPPKLTELQVINRPSKELEYGETFQFEVEGADQYGDYIYTGTITWSVNDEQYGTIDENGNFTAGEYSGNCYVWASVGSIESEIISITIIEVPKLTKLQVNRPSKELEYEETFQFEVEGVDQYGDDISTGKINWSVNDHQFGTIDQNGKFTAGKYSGNCYVWASVGSIESEKVTITIIEPSRLEKIELKPSCVSLLPNQTQHFAIVARDQRNQEIPLTQKIQINNQEYNILNDIQYEGSETLTFDGIDYNQKEKQFSCQITVNQDAKDSQQIIIKIGHLSAKAQVDVQPLLQKIEISPKYKELKPEEPFTFTVKGFDQTGEPYNNIFNVQWTTTSGGCISFVSVRDQVIFTGNYKRREVTVTATVGCLSDTAKVIILPVLRRLRIKPTFVYLTSKYQQKFTVQGFDQFKNEIDPGEVEWISTGGKITQNGILSLDENDSGYFQVTVTSLVQPKYTQKVRKIFLYAGIFTRIISYLISYQTLIEDLFAFPSRLANPQKQLTEADPKTDTTNSSTDGQTESTEQLDSTTNSPTQSTKQLESPTDKPTESIEQLDSTTDSSTEFTEQLESPTDKPTESIEQLDSQSDDIQQVIEPVIETEIVKDTNLFDDFYQALQDWCFQNLRKLISKVFRSISNFCLTQADAPLSASADVFVLKAESNPYKHFECLKTLKDHSGIVSSLAITPDGEKLISASWDDTIKIWNLTSGELLHTLTDHTNDVECVAITPDGQTLLSAGWDRTIKIWDLKTNKVENHLDFSQSVVFVTPTPDGQRFISGEAYNLIKVWDLNSLGIYRKLGELLKSYDHPYYWHNCIVISPDQEKIYVGTKIIKAYDLITGKLLNIMDEDNLGLVYALAITPDGQTLISGHEGMIKIWDLASNPASEVKLTLNSSAKAVYGLKLTPDGKTIISTGRKNNDKSENNDSDNAAAEESIIELWDINTGEQLHAITEKADNDKYVYSLEITPDGTNIITGYENGEIKIWGVAELALVEN